MPIVTDEEALEVRGSLDDAHVGDLLGLYGETWWAHDRVREDVEEMLSASDVIVAIVIRRSNRLVAFARALTDRTYFAMVLDVVVANDFRQRGLGRLLLDTLVEHPALSSVRSLELVCQPELVPFYRRWRFDEDVGASTLMRRVRS